MTYNAASYIIWRIRFGWVKDIRGAVEVTVSEIEIIIYRRYMAVEQLNVMVLSTMDEEALRRITAISPKIKLWDARDMLAAEQKYDSADEKFDALLAQAEVMCGFLPPKNVLVRAPKLKWFHATTTGVDEFLDEAMIQSPVIITNGRGVHATTVSELALEMILMLAKQAPLYFLSKQERKYQGYSRSVLHLQTVGILGLGNIGKRVARLAKAFGMRVIAIDETRGVRPARNVDTMFSTAQLHQLLAESDFVLLALPLTPRTNKMIGKRELKAMKPTAYLVNVGRGGTLDEEALIQALDEHRIAGAGLDTLAIEPLPTESRLWDFPNVILNLHGSGRGTHTNVDKGEMKYTRTLSTELFCNNLRRYLNGEKLLNMVNKKKGY